MYDAIPLTTETSDGRSSSMGNRLTFTVDEAAAVLGISRSAAYECIGRGEIPALRFGRRVVVPREALMDLLRATPAAAPSRRPLDHGRL